MGFSLTGLLLAVLILVPNLLILIFPPTNKLSKSDAGFLFTLLERVGQVSCIFILVMSKENYQSINIDSLFVLFGLCILFYYGLWIRYVVKGHDFKLLYKPIVLIPIPMAVFPVFAFFFVSLWSQSTYLVLAVILLAVGHFVNSWHTYKQLSFHY
ncbi:hypothetical protein [Paraliobacillus sediminis]|uniref:hypothetical protein n=1 Tax=Paraliobacillus sediminis TaxID=1885916 RepID=UPI000E3C63BD|nr:hypothetical protein [Paraliobacillus sediminis]